MEKRDRVPIVFEDMTFGSTYQFLEEGKDDNEINEIAAKHGIVMPSKDLAIFKGRYAMVDEANKNKCTLPKKEVKKSLKTLKGKALDKDHKRKSVIGHWLEATLEDNEIISYGAFLKSNFPEDYEDIKKRMKEGKLKISFEAWGDRETKTDGSYDLTNIEFAGGAFLFDTLPAFEDAEVLEFAKVMETNEEDVEMGKVEVTENYVRIRQKDPSEFDDKSFRTIFISKSKGIKAVIGKLKGQSSTTIQSYLFDKSKWSTTEAKNWIKKHEGSEELIVALCEDNDELEEAKLSFNWDKDTIARMMAEAECPTCKMKGWFDVNSINFDENKIDGTCVSCSGKSRMDLTPTMIMLKKGKKSTRVNANTEDKNIEETQKLNIGIAIKTNEKGGSTVEELLKKYNKATAQELIAFLEGEIASRDTVIATHKNELATVTKTVEESTKVLEDVRKELAQVKEEAKVAKETLDKKVADEKAALIKARKDELGEEFAKDMKDEDVLNDLKYELAKSKKEIAALKAAKPVTAGLEAGTQGTQSDPVFIKQNSIRDRVYKSENK